MTVSLNELHTTINSLLRVEQFKDYAPNGLQVEGRGQVRKIVSGVTASQRLIDAAIEHEADAILVHHGYFWRGEDSAIVGIKKRRIETLLSKQVSLLAYHLPLDAHAQLGNNVQLGLRLGFEQTGELGRQNNHPIGLIGRLPRAMSCSELGEHMGKVLHRPPQIIEAEQAEQAEQAEKGEKAEAKLIETVAWCTGAAQGFIDKAIAAGVDAYISGEISEPTVHSARESGVHYFAAGHHATERYGVQALAEHLKTLFDIEHEFIDIDNPV